MQVKKFDSINVVPFIDIMLVLLVIVLTTATFVAKGIIPVDLPNAKNATKQDNKKTLIITIKADGEILFDKEQVQKEQIKEKLSSYKNDTPIHINCDKEAKFEHFVVLLDALEEKEFKNLGIVTKEN